MHKKINATTEKIYNAFAEVLLEKAYADVRIQDVLDKSGVARSTFYAHYKTKEELLKSICSTIFGHVFSHSLAEEKATIFQNPLYSITSTSSRTFFITCTTKKRLFTPFCFRKARTLSSTI